MHVRISQDLLGQIKKAAQDTYLTANPKPNSVVNLTSTIISALNAMPAYQKTMDFLQDPVIAGLINSSTLKNFIDTFRETGTVRKLVVNGFQATGATKETAFTATLIVPATMHFCNRYQNAVEMHINDFPEPFKTEAVTAIQSSIDAIAQWEKDFTDYTKKTGEIFDACKSTKQLLDTWSAAEAFLPQHVIKKIHEKKTESEEDKAAREKREAFTAGDLDSHILIAGMLSNIDNGS